MNDPPPDILQRWLHSHEDDSATETVFRPATFSFPPSRGRSGFDLRSDGSYVDIGIAAADGSEERDGTWRLDGEVLTLACDAHGSGRRRLRLLSCDPDRLVVQRLDAEP